MAQPDGRLLVVSTIPLTVGPFPVPAQQPLRRLTATGALDATFTPVQFEGNTYQLAYYGPVLFQASGKLLVGGDFSTVNGMYRPSLVRLENVLSGLAPEAARAGAALAIYPNPTHDVLTLRRPATEGPATATLLDLLGRPVRRWSLTMPEQALPLGAMPAGAYIVRVVSANGVATRTVIIE